MPSGRALHQSYEMPLAQPIRAAVEPATATGINWQMSLLPPGGVQWNISDNSADANIRFSMTVDVNGQIPDVVEKTLLCKMICMIIISNLHDSHLVDAYESLVDIYKWQLEAKNVLDEEPRLRHLNTSTPQKLGKLW
jgi:hypothetical protein